MAEVPAAVPTATQTHVIQVSPHNEPPVSAQHAASVSGLDSNVLRWKPLVAKIMPADTVTIWLWTMQCESHGDPNAVSPYGDEGLLQIASLHPDASLDPLKNIQAAYRISDGGRNMRPWPVCGLVGLAHKGQ